MANNLIEECNKYIKKGKIDKFQEYIKENNLTQEFVKTAFNTYFRVPAKGEEYDNAVNVSNFALKISMQELTEKYGEKLSNRFAQIIYNTSHPSQRIFDLFRVMNTRQEPVTEMEAGIIEKMLNMALDENNIIGTHITGGEIRRSYNK